MRAQDPSELDRQGQGKEGQTAHYNRNKVTEDNLSLLFSTLNERMCLGRYHHTHFLVSVCGIHRSLQQPAGEGSIDAESISRI